MCRASNVPRQTRTEASCSIGVPMNFSSFSISLALGLSLSGPPADDGMSAGDGAPAGDGVPAGENLGAAEAPDEGAAAPEEPGGSGAEGQDAGAQLPGVDEGPAPAPAPASDPAALGLRPRVGTTATGEAPSPAVPAPKVDGDALPPLRVAIGYSVEAPGTKEEKALLDRLESGVAATVRPETSYRRLRPGSATAPELCGEGRDDLIVLVGYLPDRAVPVLLPHDCAIDEPLGVRDAEAADSPELIAALWEEHSARVAQGAKERRRRLNPKLRTGLIAGGAAVVIAGAITAILIGVLRTESTVLRVEPE